MIISEIELLEPWIPETSKIYLDELFKEISEEHVLYGTDLDVVARRMDKDEILFQFKSNPNKYVQVHLTWKKGKELNPIWPISRIFVCIEDWVNEVMRIDNREY